MCVCVLMCVWCVPASATCMFGWCGACVCVAMVVVGRERERAGERERVCVLAEGGGIRVPGAVPRPSPGLGV